MIMTSNLPVQELSHPLKKERSLSLRVIKSLFRVKNMLLYTIIYDGTRLLSLQYPVFLIINKSSIV